MLWREQFHDEDCVSGQLNLRCLQLDCVWEFGGRDDAESSAAVTRTAVSR